MKKTIFLFLILAAVLLSACGKSAEPQQPAETKSEIQLVSEALEGSWKSIDRENIYSIWTFHNGQYVVETYIDGELLPNSTLGSYRIGTEAIHTMTEDQENKVEGRIPYTFSDGVLELNGANGDLEKIK